MEKLFTWIKNHKVIFSLIILIIFIIIPILFYTPSHIGIIPRDEVGNVLSYYGAILGGLLTIFGVAWTLYYQEEEHKKDLDTQKNISDNELKQKELELEELRKQRKENISIQYMPILKLNSCNLKESVLTRQEDFYDIDNELIINNVVDWDVNCQFELENIGRGELYNFTVSAKTKTKFLECKYEKPIDHPIIPGEKFKFYFPISLNDYEKNKYLDFEESIKVNIKYKNLLDVEINNHLYLHIHNIGPTITYDEVNEEAFQNDDNTLLLNHSKLFRT